MLAIRRDLFVHMQKLPVSFFDMNSKGDLMSRYTNDVDVVGEMLNNTAVQLFFRNNDARRNICDDDIYQYVAFINNICHDTCYYLFRQISCVTKQKVLCSTAEVARCPKQVYRGDNKRPESCQGFLP